MDEQPNLGNLEIILAQVRALQIERLESVFKTGFKLPEKICEKYRNRYLLECKTDPPRLTYKSLFTQFWTEVREQINVPSELNSLDLMTLFGEVCLGEHRQNIILYPKVGSTVH